SMSAATGRPLQGHLVYAANLGAWWLNYLSGTQSLSAVYSFDFATWTAPTGSPLALKFAHSSEGRNFGFGYASISGVDVQYMQSAYGANGLLYSRFILGSTWSNTHAETTFASAASPDGCVTAFDRSNFPVLAHQNNVGSAVLRIGSNADAGT